MYLVGTDIYPGLECMIDFLCGTHQVPITLVSYEVFEIGDGHKILVRELTDPETTETERQPSRSVAEVCVRADRQGIGEQFRMILKTARRQGMYPRPYRASIMYTPPSNRTHMLFTVRNWTQSDGLLQFYFGPSAFAEFYPVDEETVRAMVSESGWQHMTGEEVEEFVRNLDRLFAEIADGEDE